MNLLSIGAAYGVVVAMFQWGWGKSLIGLESTVPIVSFVPMFMFAILFGLSMDYEVFLLSRVREEYLHTRDNTRSVTAGIASTARVIASAALIMISVFFGFVLGADPIVKMMGVGLAVAVFLDATIVRPVVGGAVGDRVAIFVAVRTTNPQQPEQAPYTFGSALSDVNVGDRAVVSLSAESSEGERELTSNEGFFLDIDGSLSLTLQAERERCARGDLIPLFADARGLTTDELLDRLDEEAAGD